MDQKPNKQANFVIVKRRSDLAKVVRELEPFCLRVLTYVKSGHSGQLLLTPDPSQSIKVFDDGTKKVLGYVPALSGGFPRYARILYGILW